LNRAKQLSKNEISTFPKMLKNNSIPLTDIVHITVIGHNVALKMKNGEELIYRMTLLELVDFLPSDFFLQITRNMLINIGYVTSFTDSSVCVEDQHFMISVRNRKKIVPALKAQRNFLYKTTD
jgi:DNA-binding LytR/AlgR family response regulator